MPSSFKVFCTSVTDFWDQIIWRKKVIWCSVFSWASQFDSKYRHSTQIPQHMLLAEHTAEQCLSLYHSLTLATINIRASLINIYSTQFLLLGTPIKVSAPSRKSLCFGLTFTNVVQWLIAQASPCSIHLVLAQAWERIKLKIQQGEGHTWSQGQSTVSCSCRAEFMFMFINRANPHFRVSTCSPIRVGWLTTTSIPCLCPWVEVS